MKVLDLSNSHAEFVDEIINVPNSNTISLVHDVFFNSVGKPFEIYTQAGEGGTKLVDSTDYVVGTPNTLTEVVNVVSPDTPYQTLSIVNATYHNTDLYLRYFPIVDFANSEKWNNDIPWLELSAIDNFTFQKRREYRYNKLYLMFTRQVTIKTITLPDPTDDFWRGVEIMISVEGSGAGDVTIQGPNSNVIYAPGRSWNTTSLTYNGNGSIIFKSNGVNFDVISHGIWDKKVSISGADIDTLIKNIDGTAIVSSRYDLVQNINTPYLAAGLFMTPLVERVLPFSLSLLNSDVLDTSTYVIELPPTLTEWPVVQGRDNVLRYSRIAIVANSSATNITHRYFQSLKYNWI